MARNKVEILLDALISFKGSQNPESILYQICNPLGIKSFAKPGKHITDDEGRRVFTSLLAGYKAGLFDLSLKISGNSRAGLKPTDTLENLLGVYGISGIVPLKHVLSFVKRALNDQNITRTTPLSFFLENEVKDGRSE